MASAAGPAPAAAASSRLDVPYLPQTEALCGGAAAAMLFRYWGEAHASVQQFAPLVDRRAGGIADTALIDAIRERHWSAVRLQGSIDTLRGELAAARPPMILIEDRPQRYHYVIVVGIDDKGVQVHDPAWGPARFIDFDTLSRVWAPSGFWTLRVTPGDGRRAAGGALEGGAAHPPVASASDERKADATSAADSVCARRLDAALDEISIRGLASADALLTPLIEQCPADAGPLRELAGVRFAQRRWQDASTLATAALSRAPHDAYAADVLGSSRFMLNDYDGALRAWNIAGRPTLDSVRITGVTRTRYSILAEALALPPDSLLTVDAFRLARRRLQGLPDVASSRLSLRPGDDGFAVAEVAVVERATLPHTPVQWAAASAQAAINREVTLNLPGRTGQGETWSGSWRWWDNRPLVSMEFAAPLVRRPGGVWRVGLSWDAQSYGPIESSVREERLRGGIGLSTWLSSNLRADVSSALDGWRDSGGGTAKTLNVAAALERRMLDDRLGVQVSAGRWFDIGGADAFSTAAVDASVRSRRNPAPLVLLARAGASVATEGSPRALWSGAGEGRSRAPLLRAHALLRDGSIDGPVFGRRLTYGTVEVQHWLRHPRFVQLAAAAFTDAAAAADRPAFAQGLPFQVDTGAGIRIRVPGRSGLFRIDYAHGVRDGAKALLIGWQAVE